VDQPARQLDELGQQLLQAMLDNLNENGADIAAYGTGSDRSFNMPPLNPDGSLKQQ
jgi:hypothetical protein